MVDSRAARVLADGARDMVDADEWQWIAEHARGSYDHLIIASTLPVFMLEAIHYLEAWNEAVCSGAWGRLAARLGEKLRRALDLEHWPAFQRSFRSMLELLHELAEGPDAPGTITFIGGDVHTAYIAEISLGERQQSRVFQVVCSPFRNPLLRASSATIRCSAPGPRGPSAARSRAQRARRAGGRRLAHRDAGDLRQLDRRARARRAARAASRSAGARRRRRRAGRSRPSTSAT